MHNRKGNVRDPVSKLVLSCSVVWSARDATSQRQLYLERTGWVAMMKPNNEACIVLCERSP